MAEINPNCRCEIWDKAAHNIPPMFAKKIQPVDFRHGAINSSLSNDRFAFAFCKSTHFKRSASAGRFAFQGGVQHGNHAPDAPAHRHRPHGGTGHQRYHRLHRKSAKDGRRQSFVPGEITAEDANRLGCELAKRFTKGNHAYIVCTHIDKAHIHNHVIWSSTALSQTRKFRNFWGSSRRAAAQRLTTLPFSCIISDVHWIMHIVQCTL